MGDSHGPRPAIYNFLHCADWLAVHNLGSLVRVTVMVSVCFLETGRDPEGGHLLYSSAPGHK